MEVWQLVLMILAIVLLVFMIIWYGVLNQDLASLLDKLLNLQ